MSSSKSLKVVAFNGSSDKNGHTSSMINIVFKELRKEGIECEMVMLGGYPVTSCKGCGGCKETHKCVLAKEGDPVNMWMKKTLEADGIILASPVHFSNVSVEMKSYIDRIGYMSICGGQLLKNKVGAGLAAGYSGGCTSTLDCINKFFGCEQIHIIGSNGWNISLTMQGGTSGEVSSNLKNLASNMAYVLKKLNANEEEKASSSSS